MCGNHAALGRSREVGVAEDGGSPAVSTPGVVGHVVGELGLPDLGDDQRLAEVAIPHELALDLEVLERGHEVQRRAVDCSIYN